MNNNIKVVIPARYDSTRLEGKPLLLIKGKPIFWHVFQRVLEAGVDRNNIILATDDERIYNEASSLNIPSVMTERSHASGTERINEVALLQHWHDDTIVINVQGDEPLIPAHVITQLMEFTQGNLVYDLFTLVSPIRSIDEAENPNIVKAVLGEDSRAVYFSRAVTPFNRDNPTSLNNLFRHIGIYAYTVRCLRLFCSYSESSIEKVEKLEQLRAISNGLSIGAAIVKEAPAHGVDTLEDYERIKLIMES
ncbi:3-deoxy-manno-octulosonate cytidylyltransferase [Vibrio mediterranei]